MTTWTDAPMMCQGPGCSEPITQPTEGRTRLYCEDNCRKAAYRDRHRREEAEALAAAVAEAAEHERREHYRAAARLAMAIHQAPARAAEALAASTWSTLQLDALTRQVSAVVSSLAGDVVPARTKRQAV